MFLNLSTFLEYSVAFESQNVKKKVTGPYLTLLLNRIKLIQATGMLDGGTGLRFH